MKKKLFLAGVYFLSLFALTSFSIRENPQDPPRSTKTKKHIVVEKIDDQGNKVSLDTIIEGNDVFVWNGDTIGNKSAFKWTANDVFNVDSLLSGMNFDFDFDISDNGNEKVIVVKSVDGGKNIIREFKTKGDSSKIIRVHVNSDDIMADHDVMIWNDKEGNKTFFGPGAPHINQLPDMREVFISGKRDRANVIDLSDPGIISYKKKLNKDGTEKITIVRKQADENETKNIEEIILAPNHSRPDVFFNGNPEQVKRIKIIKEDGKEAEIEIEENIENN